VWNDTCTIFYEWFRHSEVVKGEETRTDTQTAKRSTLIFFKIKKIDSIVTLISLVFNIEQLNDVLPLLTYIYNVTI
jgi:hypothetical protein